MTNSLAIAKREIRAYFNSPVAYVFLGVFLIQSAALLFFLFGGVFLDGTATMRRYFMSAPIIFMVFVPAVTMRLIAEERKTRTLEGLLTLPVSDTAVVVGKFLGALTLIAVGLVFTIAFPISLSTLVTEGFVFDWGPVIGGYFGLLLLSAAFIALGMWTSALTQDQVVAFVLGVILCAAFVFIDWLAFLVPDSLASLFTYLSADVHFDSMARGVIDTRDVVYFLSLTAVGLALCVRSLGRVRP
jgi:ABC-2 type transport system permease protein